MSYVFDCRAGHVSKRQRGFTLIELLIAVVIVGIIASIAYPSYTRYVERSTRSDAHTALLQAAAELERCYANRYSYSGCQLSNYSSPSGHYTITAVIGSNNADSDSDSSSSYLLTASTDRADGCPKDITLNARGQRSPMECW